MREKKCAGKTAAPIDTIVEKPTSPDQTKKKEERKRNCLSNADEWRTMKKARKKKHQTICWGGC